MNRCDGIVQFSNPIIGRDQLQKYYTVKGVVNKRCHAFSLNIFYVLFSLLAKAKPIFFYCFEM